MSILVVDGGTSGVRAAIVHPDATVTHEVSAATLPDSPMPGIVEFDAAAYAAAAFTSATISFILAASKLGVPEEVLLR